MFTRSLVYRGYFPSLCACTMGPYGRRGERRRKTHPYLPKLGTCSQSILMGLGKHLGNVKKRNEQLENPISTIDILSLLCRV